MWHRSKVVWLSLGVLLVAGLVSVPQGVAAAEGEAVEQAPMARFAQRPLARLLRAHLGRLMTLRAELGITAEQRQEIRGVVAEHRDALIAAHAPVVEHRQRLRDLILQGDEVDEAAIRARCEQLANAMATAAVARAHLVQDLKPILSDEQKQRIGTFLDTMENRTDAFLAEQLVDPE